MKNNRTNILLLLLLAVLISCGGKKDTVINNKEVTKDTNSTKPDEKPIDPKDVFGFYVGEFNATKFDENKRPSYSNKINMAIDSINGANLYGHSVVAGNLVGFIGALTINGAIYEVKEAKELGNNKYNGVFNFKIDVPHKSLSGTWTSNDKKMAVTQCEYKLEKKEFKYDPSVNIEQVIGNVIYDPETEHEQEGEPVTGDANTFNASTTVLKDKDISNMYKGDLEVMRNAIYARHGYSFQNRKMRYLFDDVDWYIPVSLDIRADLTDIEKKNIDLLKRYEEHASRYYDSWGR